jgi:hypothetical protein
MGAQDPVQPPRFRFDEQHEDDFDEMTFQLVRLEFPDAVKMDAPDGGTDTLLPSPGHREYLRGWQAKRYTGNISWPKCKDSLDRAVETYAISHLTFCFARNLTTGQQKLFVKHLATRHPDVKVDYWNSSELTARLGGSEEGRLVARRFFGDRDTLERIERGQRSGGVLANEKDAQDRLFAVGEFMAGSDPYFSYPISVNETHTQAAGAPDGVVMSVERVRGPVRVRTDVIPRSAEAMARFGPKGRLLFSADDAGRAALNAVQRALRQGGEAQIDAGVSTTWDQLPPMFADMVGKTVKGSVRIISERRIEDWAARVTADTDLGNEIMDFELAVSDAGTDWDFALAGTAGGLTLTIRGRWFETEERGELNIGWSHTLDPSHAGGQPRALAFLKALHGTGTMVVEDLKGDRPPIRQELAATKYPKDLSDLQTLLEAVAIVEERAGVAIGLPETITAADANDLTVVAACVRDGGQDIRFESMEFLAGPDSPLLREDPITDMTIHHNLDAKIFGRVIPLGTTILEMPPLRIIERRQTDEPDQALLKLAPATGKPAEIRSVLQPLDGD